MNSLQSIVVVLSVSLTASIFAADAPHYVITDGPFQPTWESIEKNYKVPDWYKDAKFGIWAHWGPQCEPQQGDWYARKMYQEKDPDYQFHVATYGHPSKFGFKDVINEWKAEKWNPEKQIQLYKRAGARFFVALANHHDNFDCYDSSFQPWNSVNMGPHKDIVGTWAELARKQGLPFGVSVHAARAWSWYEVAQGSDSEGPLKGVPYDGNLTKADGKGTWWEGYDPQDLYAQNHKPGDANLFAKDHVAGDPPSEAYTQKWFNRTKELIDKYHPDLLYFDDSKFPLGDAGMNIAAHFYNANEKWHGGKQEGVINTKDLTPAQSAGVVMDLERSYPPDLLKNFWQKDLCIGAWHYSDKVLADHKYRKPNVIIHLLVDVVSKNGTLLLNIPMRGDGALDDDELQFLAEMTKWMDINSEAIYATRPWSIYGEGPSVKDDATAKETTNPVRGIGPEYTAADIRFTKKGDTLYAIAMGWPTDGKITLKALGTDSAYWKGDIGKIELLGSTAKLDWKQSGTDLVVNLPAEKPCDYAVTLKITPKTPAIPAVAKVP